MQLDDDSLLALYFVHDPEGRWAQAACVHTSWMFLETPISSSLQLPQAGPVGHSRGSRLFWLALCHDASTTQPELAMKYSNLACLRLRAGQCRP